MSLYGFYFRKCKKTEQTVKNIFTVYRDGPTAVSSFEKELLIWKTNRVPIVVDDDQIGTVIKNNPSLITSTIAEIPYIFHMIVVWHFKTVAYVNRCNIWMPHDLMELDIGPHFLPSSIHGSKDN